ncbi:MAG TPA: glycosyltransferase [Anaerolineales bacterium]|nr:glycosyltransferase [Anaerolineales bacterium]
MSSLRVLYDGWSLSYEPNSPAALHLLALLAYLPAHIQPVVAFPGTPPAWIPARGQAYIASTPVSARLQWEQQILPKLRTQLEADVLHLMTEAASLLNGTRTVISPTQAGNFDEPRGEPRVGLRGRLREALAAGGTARVQALFWPEDLPPRPGREVFSLPPIVHPAFTPHESPELPSIPDIEIPASYVLYHGPDDEASLRRTLGAWTWVAGPIGLEFPLVMLGLGEAARRIVGELAETFKVRDTVRLLPALPPSSVPALYQKAAVVFHPAGVSAWGGAIRHGLACGRPVVAAETAWASAMVGPAAILVPPEDTRRLGASVIGIIVKEDLFARLQEAAEERSENWRAEDWGDKLATAYARILKFPG